MCEEISFKNFINSFFVKSTNNEYLYEKYKKELPEDIKILLYRIGDHEEKIKKTNNLRFIEKNKELIKECNNQIIKIIEDIYNKKFFSKICSIDYDFNDEDREDIAIIKEEKQIRPPELLKNKAGFNDILLLELYLRKKFPQKTKYVVIYNYANITVECRYLNFLRLRSNNSNNDFIDYNISEEGINVFRTSPVLVRNEFLFKLIFFDIVKQIEKFYPDIDYKFAFEEICKVDAELKNENAFKYDCFITLTNTTSNKYAQIGINYDEISHKIVNPLDYFKIHISRINLFQYIISKEYNNTVYRNDKKKMVQNKLNEYKNSFFDIIEAIILTRITLLKNKKMLLLHNISKVFKNDPNKDMFISLGDKLYDLYEKPNLKIIATGLLINQEPNEIYEILKTKKLKLKFNQCDCDSQEDCDCRWDINNCDIFDIIDKLYLDDIPIVKIIKEFQRKFFQLLIKSQEDIINLLSDNQEKIQSSLYKYHEFYSLYNKLTNKVISKKDVYKYINELEDLPIHIKNKMIRKIKSTKYI